MVRSPDGDTHFFDITTVLPLGDELAPVICIICTCINYILKKSMDSNLQQSRLHSYKIKGNLYPDLHIIDIDYAEDLAVINNSLIDANKLLHKFEDTAKDIDLHINA